VSLQLFGPPIQQLPWKVLFALWADETPFKFRLLGSITPRTATSYAAVGRSDNSRCWLRAIDRCPKPLASSSICRRTIPGPIAGSRTESSGRRVRFLDRVFDLRARELITR
jgi:hypothetical protein